MTMMRPLVAVPLIAVLLVVMVAAVSVRAQSSNTVDTLFVNLGCYDDDTQRILSQFYRFQPNVAGSTWNQREENFYAGASTTQAISAVAEWSGQDIFYFGGDYQFLRKGALWQYLAAFDSQNEVFLGSHGDILPNGPVKAMRPIGSMLVVGGTFTEIGVSESSQCGIAYQIPSTGDKAICMGTPLTRNIGDSGVISLAGSGDADIYAGGSFLVQGTAAHLAHYDGDNWAPIPGPTGDVTAMVEDGFGGLYFAYQSAAGIASLNYGLPNADGTLRISPIGTATAAGMGKSQVLQMLIRNRGTESESLVIAGRFDSVGNTPAVGVAEVHTASIRKEGQLGAHWVQLGPGLLGTVLSMHLSRKTGDLYFAGNNLAAVASPDQPVAVFKWVYDNNGGGAYTGMSPPGWSGECLSQSVLVRQEDGPSPPSGGDPVAAAMGVLGCTVGVIGVIILTLWFGWKKLGSASFGAYENIN